MRQKYIVSEIPFTVIQNTTNQVISDAEFEENRQRGLNNGIFN